MYDLRISEEMTEFDNQGPLESWSFPSKSQLLKCKQ